VVLRVQKSWTQRALATAHFSETRTKRSAEVYKRRTVDLPTGRYRHYDENVTDHDEGIIFFSAMVLYD